MSLETLLEAARFIELQEHAANQQTSPQSTQPVQPSLPTLIQTQQPITIHLSPQSLPSPPLSLPPQHIPQSNGQTATLLGTTIPNTSCIIPCLGPMPSNGLQPAGQHVVGNGTTGVAISGGVATNGSIVGTARSIVLTATPLRIKQVDHTGKQQIAPSNNHSGNTASIPVHGIINNSFDIINPLVFDDQGGARRKQPPLVFRSGTREVHNKLEKYRRAHLKECFDVLKQQLPATDEKKTSNLSILHSALRHIKALQKSEHECEQERERLENERLLQQQRLINLKREFAAAYGDNIDLTKLLDNAVDPDLINNKSVLNGNIVVKSEDIIASNNIITQRSTATSTPPATSLATLAISGTPSLKHDARTVTINGLKEGLGSTTYVPMTYPVTGAPLLLQKVTLVPKTPISYTAQPTNGNSAPQLVPTQQAQVVNKVLPLVTNATAAKYVIKPVVVVSTPSRSS